MKNTFALYILLFSSLAFGRTANEVWRMPSSGNAPGWAKLVTGNLSASAAIVGTQLSGSANILGSQLSASAGIVGTQLATATVAQSNLAAKPANTGYTFTVSGANATSGATYTSNGLDGVSITFTVSSTIVSASSLVTTVPTASYVPTATGTLTKTSGSGDSTINYTAVATGTFPAGSIARSLSSGSYSTSSVSDVLNLSVTLVTTGRPVFVGLIGNAAGSVSYISTTTTTGSPSSSTSVFSIYRDSTEISKEEVIVFGASASTIESNVPSSSLRTVDIVPAGTYTYKVRIAGSNGTTAAAVYNSLLIAYEI